MSTKRKIAFVGNDAVSMMNFRLGVMKALSQDYEVVMVTPQNCDLSPLNDTSIRYIPIHVERKGKNPMHDYRLYRTLKQLYRRERFDCIFHFTIKPNIYGSLAASSLGIHHINVIPGLGYTFIKRNWLFHLSCALYKYALRKTDEVWFLNHDDSDTFLRWQLVSPRQARVIPGEGINTEFFRAAKAPELPFVFLYCGRMLRSKGVELFAQAALQLKKDYPDVRWQLLGPFDADNPDAVSPAQMEEWVKQGGVEYVGTTTDVRSFIERCSCLVLPSYYMEGLPRSLMEAAAMKRPMIATNSVGCKDIVIDGVNGFLCEKKDLNSLMASMRKMLELSPDQLLKMGEEGRKRMIDRFDERIIIDIYRKVLKTYA